MSIRTSICRYRVQHSRRNRKHVCLSICIIACPPPCSGQHPTSQSTKMDKTKQAHDGHSSSRPSRGTVVVQEGPMARSPHAQLPPHKSTVIMSISARKPRHVDDGAQPATSNQPASLASQARRKGLGQHWQTIGRRQACCCMDSATTRTRQTTTVQEKTTHSYLLTAAMQLCR